MAVTGFSKLGPAAKPWLYADQGNYFTVASPTAGTGQASGSITTLADTTPYLLFKNNSPALSGIKCYLDFWRLTLTAAGGGGTVRNMTFRLDTSQSTARYTSGGISFGQGLTNAITNVNADSGVASQANVYIGALTAATAGVTRLIGNVMMREIIEIVNDTFLFDFGANNGPSASLATGGTATTARYFGMPPVVVGPQEYCLAHYWGASLTAATFENLLGWVEV